MQLFFGMEIDFKTYDTGWKAGLCKHTPNAPVNPFLENVAIRSSLYTPVKQNVQKNMLLGVQGQGLLGGGGVGNGSVSLVAKAVRVAGLDVLGTLVARGGEGPLRVPRLACCAIKAP